MKSSGALAVAILTLWTTAATAAEVIDIRVGYWEAVWTIPGSPTTREFLCITPEEIESMRFFRMLQKDCNVTRGSQTRTRYEFTAVCIEDGERTTTRGVLVAPDPMRFDIAATYESGGQSLAGNGAYRWLQQRCSPAGFPNS